MNGAYLAAIKTRACNEFPRYRKIIRNLKTVVTENVPVAGVSRDWKLYLNPNTFPHCGHKTFIIAHEALHIVSRHSERAAQLQARPREWNLAADAAIHSMLRRMGHQLPAEVLTWKQVVKHMGGSLGKHALATGVGYRIVTPQTLGLIDGRSTEFYYREILRKKQESNCNTWGGSCADNERRPWEETFEQVDTIDQPERERIVEQVRTEVSRGNVGTEYDTVTPLQRMRADAVRELTRFVRGVVSKESGNDYTSYRIPHKSVYYTRVLRPVWYAQRRHVILGLDTSGSMLGPPLAMALSVAGEVLDSFGLRDGVQCLHGGFSVSFSKMIRRVEEIELSTSSMTDMRVIIEAAEAHGAGMIILVTDCETPWPDEPTSTPLAVVTYKGASASPKWARRIELDLDLLNKQ